MSNGTPALRLVGELPRSAELVVIGGGVIGAATAFFASRAGLSTVMLEARPALATLTTPVSTGAFRLQFDNPEEIALVREGVALFRDFAAMTGLPGYEIGYREGGYLFCTTTEAGVERQRGWVAAQHGWGLDDVELLTGDEARYRFPYLSPAVRQARYRAGDGWLDPTLFTLGYAIASQAAVSLSTPATGFLLSGDRVVGVRTPRGDIACEHVVVATGPFAARVASWAGVGLDVRPTRRQKLVLPELLAVPRNAPMTIDEETAAHWRPALAGAFALWTEAGTPPGEPEHDVPTTSDFAFGLLDPASPHALARISPFWAEVWEHGSPAWLLQAGQYDYTPDHRPYLGPTHAPGLFLNTGYSGHGIMAGAGGSRLVIDLLTGAESPERNPFRPDRPMVERPLDIL